VPSSRAAEEEVQTIAELEGIRAQVHGDLRPLGSLSFPLGVWGALTLLSAIPAWFSPEAALGLYWIAAAPLGTVVVWRHFRGLERRIGVETPGGQAALLSGVGLAVVALATGVLWGTVAVCCVLAVGYSGFAWLVRSRAFAWLAAGLLVATAALQATGVDRLDVLLPLLFGGALLGTGIALAR